MAALLFGSGVRHCAVGVTSTTPTTSTDRGGPLAGLQIIELAGLGAAPFCGMVLADLGAEVVRVGRISDAAASATDLLGEGGADPATNLLDRGRRQVAIDLKQAEGRQLVLDLVADTDGFLEGFRPGVAERLGLGPTSACSATRGSSTGA